MLCQCIFFLRMRCIILYYIIPYELICEATIIIFGSDPGSSNKVSQIATRKVLLLNIWNSKVLFVSIILINSRFF